MLTLLRHIYKDFPTSNFIGVSHISRKINQPRPVKLIVGMLSCESALFEAARASLEGYYGAVDCVSEVLSFTYTSYYEKQMGANLLRQFVSLARLIDPSELAAIKHATNALEAKLGQSEAGRAVGVSRPINLDPGYIEPSKLVLASTKNYSHRIYIGQGMYAETTLQYHKGRWTTWPFSYPDYGSGAYDTFLHEARHRLLEQLSEPPREPGR